MSPDQDICENRHGGNAESRDAFGQVESKIGALHEQLLRALSSRDMTSKELERFTGIHRSTVSARLSELKAMGKIVITGARRDGAAVLRVARKPLSNLYLPTETDLF